MNWAEHILEWVGPVMYAAGLGFLMFAPRLRGKGLLAAFLVLSLTASVGSKAVSLAVRDPNRRDGIDLTSGHNREIWASWQSTARNLWLDAEVLLLGFTVQVWLRRRTTPTAADESLAGDAVQGSVCAACAEASPAGSVRCQKCGRGLRPIGLAIITVLSVVANVGILIAAAFAPHIFLKVMLAVGALVLVVVNLAARQGRNWAWAFLQWQYGLSALPLLPMAAARGGIAWLYPAAVAAVSAALIGYLRTQRVQAFCSIGR